MKRFLLLLVFMLLVNISYSQLKEKNINDSIRLENIDNTLRSYGKQNVITDKITLVSIGIVVIGTIANVKPSTMLVTNSLCSLTILAISWKADLKLSKNKK